MQNMGYFEIGHGRTGIPWTLHQRSSELRYWPAGSKHPPCTGALDVGGRVDPGKQQISFVVEDAGAQRVKETIAMLMVDYPGFTVHIFRDMPPGITVADDPNDCLFDTQNPPQHPGYVLGDAAIYDDAHKALKAWHITNDANYTIEMLTSGRHIGQIGDTTQELGPGLYMSAVPQIWASRATKRWSLLDLLSEDQRKQLGDAVRNVLHRHRAERYISANDLAVALGDIECYTELGNKHGIIHLAQPPYNIAFWKPSFLGALGIKSGLQPDVVECLLRGRFLAFDKLPRQQEIDSALKLDLSGCFLRGGLTRVAQMSVWKNEAIVDVKKRTLEEIDAEQH